MAKSKVNHPLGPEHLKILDKVLQACVETGEYCKQCEECNLDVSPEQKKNAEQMEIAKRIKAKFFPGAK